MLKKYVKKFFQGFVQGFGFLSGAIFCLSILFFIFKFFWGWNRLEKFKNSFFITPQLNEKEIEQIRDLVGSGKIISFDSLFTQTLAYYDTIITVLIGILGIVVAGAFIYIKFGSEEKSKEHAKKYIDSFLETKKFHDIVKGTIDNKVDEWGEDLSNGFDKIRKLEAKISSLEEDVKKDADKTIGNK